MVIMKAPSAMILLHPPSIIGIAMLLYVCIAFLGPEFWAESDNEIDADIRDAYSNIAPQGIQPDQEDVETSNIVKWIVFLLLYFQTSFSLTD